MSRSDADALIQRLGLAPHPEGGHFRETWRHAPADGSRGAGTAIYFLLRRGEASRWHRVDAAEIWHHYLGAPLELGVTGEDGSEQVWILGGDFAAGQQPQRIVPAGAWQRARSLGEFTLVGCTVSPAFEFAGFEMAPDGFSPAGGA
ncbi:MAG: cupin domain-containing protein [Deltaproteobacteria bacterium]|nr:cupin domain-containing protein [Deltaproteobacteria bacterium]MBW2373102.1 cupin domain-containing protein [Deltaproteobacteria bacterium]